MANMIFAEMTISLSGRFPKARSVYEEAIQSHGGTLSSYITDKVDVLISTREDVDDEKLRVVLAKGHDIPILTQYYILDCVKAGELLEQDKYVIPTTKKTKSAAAAPVPTPARAETAEKTKTGPVLRGTDPSATSSASAAAVETGEPPAKKTKTGPGTASSATSSPSAATVEIGEGGKPVRWQYYGKKVGWKDCRSNAKLEKFNQKCKRDGRQETRFMRSGGWWYEIDFAELLQTNPKTGKRRPLRRLVGGVTPSDEPPVEIPEDAEPDPDWKAKVDKQLDSEDEPEGDNGDDADETEDEGMGNTNQSQRSGPRRGTR